MSKFNLHNKKFLFAILLAASIAAFINLILIPMDNQKIQLQNDIKKAQELKQTMSTSIMNEPENKDKYQQLLQSFNDRKADLKYMSNEQIDILINKLCSQCSLSQTDFSLSSKDFATLANNDKIIVTQIRLQLTGESSGIFLFVDAVDKIKNLFIDSFTISDLAKSQNYSTTLSLYTLNKN